MEKGCRGRRVNKCFRKIRGITTVKDEGIYKLVTEKQR
jgi:hypothetical protein